MKKKLLWIVPAALALLFLVGLGIYLDYTAGQTELPKVTLPGDQEPSTSPGESTEDSTLPSSEDESATSTESAPTEETEPESTAPSQTEESSTPTTEEPSAPSTSLPEPTDPPVTEPSHSTEPTENTDLAAKEARIDELVTEVYGLRDYYTAQLLALEAAAVSEYESLPPEERTPERKQDIAFACIDAAYALEDECDSRMDAICQELSYLLLETGGSMSLITDIRYAYASEKESARSAFLEKYADYFG